MHRSLTTNHFSCSNVHHHPFQPTLTPSTSSEGDRGPRADPGRRRWRCLLDRVERGGSIMETPPSAAVAAAAAAAMRGYIHYNDVTKLDSDKTHRTRYTIKYLSTESTKNRPPASRSKSRSSTKHHPATPSKPTTTNMKLSSSSSRDFVFASKQASTPVTVLLGAFSTLVSCEGMREVQGKTLKERRDIAAGFGGL
ncbi:hypothetical protein M0804_003394 [Polistes exclamans]|nr:hypothetical protein M0804_003394 [Polistes exclamans]